MGSASCGGEPCPSDPRPLAGIRVIDLGWITAGAGTSALLGDLGADVIKVEGPSALDPFRRWDGAAENTDWWNQSPFFAFTNRAKRSLCVDLKSKAGQAVFSQLLEQADILVENYRRGVLASFGFSVAELRARFPRLIIASISSQGETGPDRDMVSYGSTLEATSGLAALTGTGEPPVMTGARHELPRPGRLPVRQWCDCRGVARASADGAGGAFGTWHSGELTSFLLGEELISAAHGVPSLRHGNADPVLPGEHLERDGDAWHVRERTGQSRPSAMPPRWWPRRSFCEALPCCTARMEWPPKVSRFVSPGDRLLWMMGAIRWVRITR